MKRKIDREEREREREKEGDREREKEIKNEIEKCLRDCKGVNDVGKRFNIIDNINYGFLLH